MSESNNANLKLHNTSPAGGSLFTQHLNQEVTQKTNYHRITIANNTS